MRVLVFSSVYPNRVNPSQGIWIQNYNKLASHFIDINIFSPVPYIPQIRLLTNSKWGKYTKQYAKIPYFKKAGKLKIFHPRFVSIRVNHSSKLNIIGVAIFLQTFLYLISFLFSFLKNRVLFKSAHLIHAFGILPAGFCATAMKIITGKPVIITTIGGELYHNAKRFFSRSLIKAALKKCDHLISVSNFLHDISESLYGELVKKSSVIPNGVDTNAFKPVSSSAMRKKLKLPMKKRILLTIGNLVEIKGHKFLIEAIPWILKKESDVFIIIIGSGPLKEVLQNQVGSLNLSDDVRFVGRKPHDEIPCWLNACDLFILPSISESFGVVIIEAMACGKPVVASDVGGITELIIQGKNGLLVQPADSTVLASNILLALEKKWNSPAIVNYAQKFSWINIIETIMRIYSRIIQSVKGEERG